MTTRARWAVASAAVLIGTAIIALPVRAWAVDLVAWIHDAGLAGVAVFAVVYVAAAVLLVPGAALTLGAGFAYGPLWGTLIVAPVSVAAAAVAFTIGRRAGRGVFDQRLARDARWAAVDRAIGGAGFRVVFLLRLSPLFPYGLLNYALGLTSVRFRDYLGASVLGMLPGTILYVYLGSLITTASGVGQRPAAGDAWSTALYWGGFAVALVAAIVVTRIARRALRQQLATAELVP